MGAFFLVRTGHASNASECEAAADILTRSGFAAPTIIKDPAATIYVFPKIESGTLALTQFPGGDFVFSCGTLMFRGLVGAAASEAFYREFDGKAGLDDEAFGHYSVVIRKNQAIHIVGDRFGGHTLYY